MPYSSDCALLLMNYHTVRRGIHFINHFSTSLWPLFFCSCSLSSQRHFNLLSHCSVEEPWWDKYSKLSVYVTHFVFLPYIIFSKGFLIGLCLLKACIAYIFWHLLSNESAFVALSKPPCCDVLQCNSRDRQEGWQKKQNRKAVGGEVWCGYAGSQDNKKCNLLLFSAQLCAYSADHTYTHTLTTSRWVPWDPAIDCMDPAVKWLSLISSN